MFYITKTPMFVFPILLFLVSRANSLDLSDFHSDTMWTLNHLEKPIAVWPRNDGKVFTSYHSSIVAVPAGSSMGLEVHLNVHNTTQGIDLVSPNILYGHSRQKGVLFKDWVNITELDLRKISVPIKTQVVELVLSMGDSAGMWFQPLVIKAGGVQVSKVNNCHSYVKRVLQRLRDYNYIKMENGKLPRVFMDVLELGGMEKQNEGLWDKVQDTFTRFRIMNLTLARLMSAIPKLSSLVVYSDPDTMKTIRLEYLTFDYCYEDIITGDGRYCASEFFRHATSIYEVA